MWRVYRAAGRPWPVLDEDDVIDYMVMEAVMLKAKKLEADEAKKEERRRWKAEQKKRLQKEFSG